MLLCDSNVKVMVNAAKHKRTMFPDVQGLVVYVWLAGWLAG